MNFTSNTNTIVALHGNNRVYTVLLEKDHELLMAVQYIRF